MSRELTVGNKSKLLFSHDDISICISTDGRSSIYLSEEDSKKHPLMYADKMLRLFMETDEFKAAAKIMTESYPFGEVNIDNLYTRGVEIKTGEDIYVTIMCADFHKLKEES